MTTSARAAPYHIPKERGARPAIRLPAALPDGLAEQAETEAASCLAARLTLQSMQPLSRPVALYLIFLTSVLNSASLK